MSIDDFCRCTPAEFDAIHGSWQKNEELRLQTSWERTRQLCACMLQPYASQRINPEDIMIFPWDDSAKAAEEDRSMSEKERKERYVKALVKYGFQIDE